MLQYVASGFLFFKLSGKQLLVLPFVGGNSFYKVVEFRSFMIAIGAIRV